MPGRFRYSRPVIERWLLTLILLLAGAIVVPSSARAAQPAEDAGQELEQLRAEVNAERDRIAELEDQLRQQRIVVERLASRLEAAPVGTTPVMQASAAPPPMPDVTPPATPETPRFDFYADTLVRLATLHQDYPGCEGCPDRTIGRFRLRFGAEGHLGRGVSAIFGFSAGDLNDPNSVYQTFGGNLGRKAATWDRAYLVVRPTRAPWLELQAGKFPYPWLRSSMTFDVDFYPEGASERAAFNVSRSGVMRTVSAQAFQVVVNEQASSPDMLLVGGQAMTTLALRNITTRVALTGVDVQRPELILHSQLDGSNVGVKNTNALIVENGAARYASAFRYANVIVENGIPTRWASLPVTAAAEYHRNLRAVSNRDTAWSLRFDAGRMQKAHDLSFSWHVFHVDQDAIVSAMGESDWRTPSNVLQYRYGVTYMLQDHVQALFTWYRGRTLDSSLPGAILIPGWAPGPPEPFANRLYFDMAYRF